MTSREYAPIDDRVAAEIKRLHKRHTKLGHDGLLDALLQQGIHVDPQELETFMKKHRIKPERFWQPWKLSGMPRWWFPGFIHYRSTRRWRLWRK